MGRGVLDFAGDYMAKIVVGLRTLNERQANTICSPCFNFAGVFTNSNDVCTPAVGRRWSVLDRTGRDLPANFATMRRQSVSSNVCEITRTCCIQYVRTSVKLYAKRVAIG